MKTFNLTQEEIILLVKLLESYIRRLESDKVIENDISSTGHNAIIAHKI